MEIHSLLSTQGHPSIISKLSNMWTIFIYTQREKEREVLKLILKFERRCRVVSNELPYVYLLIGEALKDADSSEYIPIYEDKDADWMLIGDVPWR